MQMCAECGKPIMPTEPSYYRKTCAQDIGVAVHSACGDPLGIKEKDKRIAKLEAALRPFADRVYNDNGDVTYNTSAHDTEDLWRAYVSLK